ncbi:N-acetylmuramic acid 6-phosphate etherase [Acidocella sp.]|uniref:N-acetylmuramic acid 6-phosphate etherase n=1 Tax=Acidocella sp. TaxID=50710 RepID=UPI00260CDFEF|nr:N-acetylmuramic acid 6-phosphate etherase [Acidocella sp.]MDD2795200.1 N-acetylmuramic acid 6-phosphate etherase [Acidocella sp.]
MIISAPNLVSGGAFTGPGAVEIRDGRIVKIFSGNVEADICLTHGFLSPGLIDLHNNGAFGVDCATATPAQWDGYIAKLAECGVTSVLPTVITAPLEVLHAAAANVAGAMARHGAILGLHLEGPFLAPARRGAHPAQHLRLPDAAALDELLAMPPMRAVLRLLTLAPELPGALAAIQRLAAAGVTVSLGHTDATASQMSAGVDAGARMVTHVFNAQPPLHHRAPGAPGVALNDARLSPCLIADGVHVDPLLLKLAFAACPRAIAVTDSILLAGLEPGAVREFGGAPARLGPQGVGLRADGTIAGAGITLDEGVRRLISYGVPPETALAAATSRPAEALGLVDRGRLAPGQRADIIWWGDDFSIQRVWTAGAATPALTTPRGTEAAQAALADLDERPTLEIIRAFLAQEAAAQSTLNAVAPALAALADAVAARLRAGGRLFYAGAGTSGRLGLLDAVECGPTFGLPPGIIVPLLAGGTAAFIQAAEGAEDDTQAGAAALRAHHFTAADALVGIAASGATPFTLAAVRYARGLGALTGAIVNNPGSPLAELAEIAVQIASGPEVIAGSTRLSAGTTQKIALNTLSSTVMLRQGKVFGPYMVDMRATNAKLRRRALRMTMDITGADETAARIALAQCHDHVKTAALMLLRGLPAAEAAQKLKSAEFSLRRALNAEE